MIKMEFVSELKIDKDVQIIKEFIELYWKIFITKNKNSKEICFVKRSEIVKNSKFSRRNCYKHLRRLLFSRIFIENGKSIIPSALIFRINKKWINPSEIIFGTRIENKLKKDGLVTVNPKIPAKKIKELSRLIISGKSRLYDILTIPFNISEQLSFSSSFRLNEMPKVKKVIGLWKQNNAELSKNEKILFKTLNPYRDPSQHNSSVELAGTVDEASPLFELEKDKRTYIFAGWAVKFQYKESERDAKVIGDYTDRGATGSELRFYDDKKRFLCKKEFVFPSSKKGIPIADMSPIIFTRGNYTCPKNPDYIGFYDFKYDNLEIKYLLNHSIIHFSRFSVPLKARFLRIYAGKNSLITPIYIVPADKINTNFIKKRMDEINTKKFVQDSYMPLQTVKLKFIDTREFENINILLNKASFTREEEKHIFLREALNRLIDYSYIFKEKSLKNAKQTLNAENIVKMTYILTRGITHIHHKINECSKELNEKVAECIRDNEKFYSKLIPIVSKKINKVCLSFLIEAKYNSSFSLFAKKDYSSFEKRIKELQYDMNIIEEPLNKLQIIRNFIVYLKIRIEQGLFLENTQPYLENILWLNNQLSSIFNELALKTREFENEKGFDKRYLLNKCRYYETLSLYYSYQSIIFKTKYCEKTSTEERRFQEILNMLNNFETRIF